MVVSLVDKNGMSFKAFPSSCIKNDLRVFSWGRKEWFIKSLGNLSSSEAQIKAVTTMRLCCTNGSQGVIGQLSCDVF